MSWDVPHLEPDPFRDEERAEDYAQVVALPGEDGYHRDQARNWRWMAARSLAYRIRADAGDLADSLADLHLTDAERHDVVAQAMGARRTLGRLVADLENLNPADTQGEPA